MLLACAQMNSQVYEFPKTYTGKKHRGFYLSLALGVNSTGITSDSKNYGTANLTGEGGGMDIKIGGAISENWILHATILSHGITGPKVSSDYWGIDDLKADNNLSISQGLIGGGFTYYNYYNFLFSASAGFGGFTFENEAEDVDFSTDNGFSYQLKVGKEWWVSPKWGLGVALFYHNINCINQKGNIAEEKLRSNSFGVVFNATRNGRK